MQGRGPSLWVSARVWGTEPGHYSKGVNLKKKKKSRALDPECRILPLGVV